VILKIHEMTEEKKFHDEDHNFFQNFGELICEDESQEDQIHERTFFFSCPRQEEQVIRPRTLETDELEYNIFEGALQRPGSPLEDLEEERIIESPRVKEEIEDIFNCSFGEINIQETTSDTYEGIPIKDDEIDENVNNLLHEDPIEGDDMPPASPLEDRDYDFEDLEALCLLSSKREPEEIKSEIPEDKKDSSSVEASAEDCNSFETLKKSKKPKFSMKKEQRSIHLKSENKKHVCEICEKIFLFKSHLRKHIKSYHLEENSEEHSCEICEETFSENAALKEHMTRYHSADKSSLFCDICQKTYTSRSGLRIHQRNYHEKTMRYSCADCDKTFTKKQNMVSHHRVVHQKIKKHMCEQCEKTFSCRRLLNQHVAINHETARDFECETCKKRFATPTNLRTHVKNAHEGKSSRKRKSPQSKKVKDPNGRKKEGPGISKAVEGPKKKRKRKKELCTICGIAVVRLLRHLREVHTEPHLKCPYCAKMFTRRRDFVNHVAKIHEKVEKLSCTYCDKKFIIQRDLREHVREKHSDKPVDPE
jgi:KRAB domain-containing zinc finger protein